MTRKFPVVLITGACGGMGRACARRLGLDHQIVLSDMDQDRLDELAHTLRDEGYAVAGSLAGDLSQPGIAGQLIAFAHGAGRLNGVVHTAGLSPALAPWHEILLANVTATVRILNAIEARPLDGVAAVFISSMAGHLTAGDATLDTILEQPFESDFLERAQQRLAAHVSPNDQYALASPAYAFSKRAMIRLCEQRAATWGLAGGRIVTISPGTIWTPMGRREVDVNPAAASVVKSTPVGRWGTPQDIAAAVEFLLSSHASFINGCDLRIDGGATAVLLNLSN
ncbi:SDR family oxidoreductase [Pseudomonas sp. NFX15]|uniref:SDR family oxidoreductase n=1 Tax=Pseudomonas sp. NFX15 TaxID=2816958 RepID=UPI003B8CE18C